MSANNNQQSRRIWLGTQRLQLVKGEVAHLHDLITTVAKKQETFRENVAGFGEVRGDIQEVKEKIWKFRANIKSAYRFRGIGNKIRGLRDRVSRLEIRQESREFTLGRRRRRQEEEAPQEAVEEEKRVSGVSILEANEVIDYFNKIQRLRARQNLRGGREEQQLVGEEVTKAWEELKEKFIRRLASEEVTEDYQVLVEIIQSSCVRLLRKQEEWRVWVEGVQKHAPVTSDELGTILELHRRIEKIERQQDRYLRFNTLLEWLDTEIQAVTTKVQRVLGEEETRPGVSWGYRKLVQIVQRRLQRLVQRQIQFRAELSERDIGNGGEFEIEVHVTTPRHFSSI